MTAPLLDTPQTVTVVPQQIIREQASSTVMDALRNVPGITFRAGEGGAQGDVPYIRGFDARNDIFRDGVRDPGWYTRDSFSVDSVEVLKGPSSFMFGRGSTGGVINMNTQVAGLRHRAGPPTHRAYPVKSPLFVSAPSADFIEVMGTVHTGPGARSVLDANKQINEQAAARIQVMGQRYDIPGRDHVEENRWGVAPSLTYKFNDQTRATLCLHLPARRQHSGSRNSVRCPQAGARRDFHSLYQGRPGTASCPAQLRTSGKDRRTRCNRAFCSRVHERHQDHEHIALRECRSAQPGDIAE